MEMERCPERLPDSSSLPRMPGEREESGFSAEVLQPQTKKKWQLLSVLSKGTQK